MEHSRNPYPKAAPAAEPGLALGLALIAVLALLLVGALVAGIEPGRPPKPGLGNVLLGVYVMAWGGMFFASYFFEHKTFFFRALIWLCEHFSHPASRKMALFYAALAIVLGGMGVLAGVGAF